MTIRIICVGKLREPWLKQGCEEYLKRLSRFAQVKVEEVADAPDHLGIPQALAREGAEILAKIKPGQPFYLVDLGGKQLDSVAFSQQVVNWIEAGGAQLTLVIGGSNGFSQTVREQALGGVSLSKLTFPHTLTRLIVLEQLFRALKIARRETYHK